MTRANKFRCFSHSLSICCVRRTSQYRMTSATPNVEKPMFNCDFRVRKLGEKERERMRCDALPRKRLYVCECVHELEFVNERAITGILFRTKVIVIGRINILSSIRLIARYTQTWTIVLILCCKINFTMFFFMLMSN